MFIINIFNTQNDMKGEAVELIKIFDGADKRFIIPLYQRNYDWKEENCKQLFSDLISLHNNPKRKSHFFGSIVSQIQEDTDIRLIIDGQQRITTVSLILIALVKAAKKGDIKYQRADLIDKIFKSYLVDEYLDSERKVKLKPIKNDMKAFDALLYLNEDQYLKESNVTRNYLYFYDKIIKCGLSLDELFNVIKRLVIIDIKLSREDDAQLIFESLNSTGLDLSEADKIRNYMLMSASSFEQEKLYIQYWNPIEECTSYNASPFIRDYLTLKQGKITKNDDVYFSFKRFVEDSGKQREELLSDIYEYAKIYQMIVNKSTGINKIDNKLKQLSTLDTTIAYPYFFGVIYYFKMGNINEDILYKVLDTCENYWARRIMCNMPSNAMNKIFSTLHREIINELKRYNERKLPESPEYNYADILIYLLRKKEGSGYFPTDEMLKEDFTSRQVYKITPQHKLFILERLENRNNVEIHDVVSGVKNGTITIEHIMPQTLTDDWKRELGPDYERIHSTYLHTIANLTLTGYNSTYSNYTFIKKRDIENGFKANAYRLNNEIKLKDKWTETELIERGKQLYNEFIKLWPLPTSKYVPIRKENVIASLDDEDAVFTNKKLIAFFYKDVRYSVSNWKEMLIKICAHCLADNSSAMEWMCANQKNSLSNTQDDNKTQFADGKYVWADNSTSTKIHMLTSIFNECGIPLSDLKFEFWTPEEEIVPPQLTIDFYDNE